jgi:hypothetical protein
MKQEEKNFNATETYIKKLEEKVSLKDKMNFLMAKEIKYFVETLKIESEVYYNRKFMSIEEILKKFEDKANKMSE